MTALLVTAVSGGAELDRVTLDDQGKATYRTGVARDMIEARRQYVPGGADDAKLLAALSGWSNGYIRVADDTAGSANQRLTTAGLANDDDDQGAAPVKKAVPPAKKTAPAKKAAPPAKKAAAPPGEE